MFHLGKVVLDLAADVARNKFSQSNPPLIEIAFAFAWNRATSAFSPHFDEPLPRPRREHNRLKSSNRVKPVLDRDQCCNYLLCGRISRSERSSRLLRDPRERSRDDIPRRIKLLRNVTRIANRPFARLSATWTKGRGIIRKSSSDRNLPSMLHGICITFVYAKEI